jgi:hypothetical protein
MTTWPRPGTMKVSEAPAAERRFAMMHKVKGGVTSGGPAQHGHSLQFTIQCEDGDHAFECRDDQLPKMIVHLRHFGELAARLRQAQPGTLMELNSVFTVSNVMRTGHTPDGKQVAIEFGIQDGFPMQLTMTPDQVRKTIEFLEEELGRLPVGDRGRI